MIALLERIAITLTVVLLVTVSAARAAERPGAQIDVCQLLIHPEQYADRLVTVKGYVFWTFEEFSLSSPACPGLKVWLAYADELEAAQRQGDIKEKPLKVRLKRDKHLRALERQIQANNCSTANIEATLSGRVDHLEETIKHENGGTQIVGFGKDGVYSTRLIISSVLESSPVSCESARP
jgi:hypothetical protein